MTRGNVAVRAELGKGVAVKERPILFSGPMVRAILEGRKHMTRRVVKPSPGEQARWLTMESLHRFVQSGVMVKGGWQMWHPNGGPRSPYGWVRCPYGQPGDRLWVRETWARVEEDGYPAGLLYRATDTVESESEDLHGGRWRPSIHMPRWASRLTLEVTEVRVERLQDISEEDAKAEGAPLHVNGVSGGGDVTPKSHRTGFVKLWGDINGLESWFANPWVWVVSFEKLGGA